MKKLLLVSGMICGAFFSSHAQWTKVSSDGAVDLVVQNNALFACSIKILKTTDGSAWTESSTGMSGSPDCLKMYNNTLYASTNGSTLFKSVDDGANWTQIDGRSGLTSVSTTSIYVEGTNMTYGTTGGGKWQYSINSGTSWSGSDLPWGVSPGNIGVDMVKLGSNIYSCGYDYVFKSADFGKNWDTTNKFGATNALCVQGSVLYCAGYGSGVNKSTDGGATWTCVLGCNMTDLTRTATRLLSDGSNLFVAGALGKVSQSSNGGTTWTDLSGDGTVLTGAEIITAIAIFKNELYISTGTGIYKRAFTGGTTGVQESPIPKIGVFPNPTSEQINVTIDHVSASVKLTVMDLQGRIVKTQYDANTQSARLNVADLNPGVYQVLVETENGSAIQKVIKH